MAEKFNYISIFNDKIYYRLSRYMNIKAAFNYKFIFISILVYMLAGYGNAAGVAPSDVVASDNALFLLIFYVVLALATSFLCSIAEAVLLSITPSYIETLKPENPKLAEKLLALKVEKIDQSLAAILTLNTIAHTVGAIGAGAQATAVFGSAWFGVFSAVMTLMVLIISEIIPKTIGAVYWQKLTGATVWYVNALVKLLYPLVWLSELLTKFISHGHHSPTISRDEFLAMARASEATGEIQDSESRIINNLLQLRSLKITDIMTPATVISALQEESLVTEAVEEIKGKPFSRWPIYGNDINDIKGFVLRSDILLKHAENDHESPIHSFKRDIKGVPTSMHASRLLELFLTEKHHVVIVIDEHGSTRGLVSLEDVIETLIGVEIVDESDTVEDMRLLARKLWQERANALGIEEKHGPNPKDEF